MSNKKMKVKLENDMVFEGKSFGSEKEMSGEIVFNTGMVGYPEAMTDPSYYGQIMVLTHPLIGNYGVPEFEPEGHELLDNFESANIQVNGLIVSEYSEKYAHCKAGQSLGEWMEKEGVPGVTGIDTRKLTQVLREKGTMLGKVYHTVEPDFYDPNKENLIEDVSIEEQKVYGEGENRIALLDCGCKYSIIKNLTKRGVEVVRLPWDTNIEKIKNLDVDALFISNGPGDPKLMQEVIDTTSAAIEEEMPVCGICLGNQILALAVGAETYKLKYGHRSQNQPVIDQRDKQCYITSQNHGYNIKEGSLPEGWKKWFVNLNDETIEGIRHESGKYLSTQFHPEAEPGPTDTQFIFDQFVEAIINN